MTHGQLLSEILTAPNLMVADRLNNARMIVQSCRTDLLRLADRLRRLEQTGRAFGELNELAAEVRRVAERL